MNEIWFRVNRLFPHRVNTVEAVRLKMEVYGVLIARYAGYQAAGAPKREALERTLASITSADELLHEAAGARIA